VKSQKNKKQKKKDKRESKYEFDLKKTKKENTQ